MENWVHTFSVYALCWGMASTFRLVWIIEDFLVGKLGTHPSLWPALLLNDSVPSSNQKNLFRLNIQLVIYIKAEFALILTAKRLFLNWNWAVVQQCSFLCIMPCVSALQPAWVQLDLLQEGPGMMGPAELAPSFSPHSSFSSRFEIQIECNFQLIWARIYSCWASVALKFKLEGENRYHLSPRVGKGVLPTFYSWETGLHWLIPVFLTNHPLAN